MANFPPLKQYILINLKRSLVKNNIKSPFLDIGGGTGDVSDFLAKQGMTGKYIDFSKDSYLKALELLRNKNIIVENKDFLNEHGRYNSVICFDVIEHVENDEEFISHIDEILNPGGHLVVVVPVNKSEWRWDDEYYGHYRRYEPEEFIKLMRRNGFSLLERISITFPIFWVLRRIYTRIKKKPDILNKKKMQTKKSALCNAWNMGIVSGILSIKLLWYPVFIFQKIFSKTVRGHEHMFVFRRNNL